MVSTKVTLNIPSELLEKVKQAAKDQNITVTDVFRRALQLDLFWSKEEAAGGKLLIEKPNGSFVQLLRTDC